MNFEKAMQGYFIVKSADGYSPTTLAMYQWALNIIKNYLNNKEVGEITENDLMMLFGWLRTDYQPTRIGGDTSPLKGRSLDNIWTAMRSFFGWCESEKLVTSRPDKKIKRPKYKTAEVQPLNQDEIARLIRACEKTQAAKTTRRESWTMLRPTAARDIALVMVLLDTGMRVSECARLRIRDVDVLGGEITIQPFGTGKKTRPRHVYVGKVSKKAIWRYLNGRETPQPTEHLFLTDDEKPMNRMSILQLITRLGKRAGIAHCHPHRFRHTFALEYLRNGGDPFTLQRMLGHSSMDMVHHYMQLVSADIEAAHKRASPVDRWRL